MNLPAGAYREDHQRVALFEGLLEDIRTLPGGHELMYARPHIHGPTVAAEDVAGMLLAWHLGDENALKRLIPIVYQELRRVARARLRAR